MNNMTTIEKRTLITKLSNFMTVIQLSNTRSELISLNSEELVGELDLEEMTCVSFGGFGEETDRIAELLSEAGISII